jgi:hypothetical protein
MKNILNTANILEKTKIKQLVLDACSNSHIDDCLAEATIACIRLGYPVTLVHNEKRYHLHPSALYDAIQNAIAIEDVKIPGKSQE